MRGSWTCNTCSATRPRRWSVAIPPPTMPRKRPTPTPRSAPAARFWRGRTGPVNPRLAKQRGTAPAASAWLSHLGRQTPRNNEPPQGPRVNCALNKNRLRAVRPRCRISSRRRRTSGAGAAHSGGDMFTKGSCHFSLGQRRPIQRWSNTPAFLPPAEPLRDHVSTSRSPRTVAPGRVRAEHPENPLQRLPIVHAGSTRVRHFPWEQRPVIRSGKH